MNALELWNLKRLCDQLEVDYQEIDNSLSYWENSKHLRSLVFIEVDLDEWESRQEQYLEEHRLTDYIIATMDGKTKSEKVGPPWEPRFSLARYMEANR